MNLSYQPIISPELKNLVLDDHCFAFVGAGLSKSTSRGSMGVELVEKLLRWCNVPYDQSDLDKWKEMVDKCIEISEERCNECLRSEFPRHPSDSRTATSYLSRLPFDALLTTNFDPWIGDHCYPDFYNKLYIYPVLPINRGSNRCIYYLHGRFIAEEENASIHNLVFGKHSFDEAYFNSPLRDFLLDVFTFFNVLFIGFDPTDAYISALLANSVKIRDEMKATYPGFGSHLGQIYALLPVSNVGTLEVDENLMLSKLHALGVIPIPYDKKGSDHHGLEAVLYSLIQEKYIRDRVSPFPQSTSDSLGEI